MWLCTDVRAQAWFDEVVARRRRVCGLSGVCSPGRVAPTWHVSWVRGSTGCGVSVWVCSFRRARRWAELAVLACQC